MPPSFVPARPAPFRCARAFAVGGLLAAIAAGPAPARTSEPPIPEARPWRHLSMNEVDLDLGIFRPVRARYHQRMYDVEGSEELQGGSIVTIDVDRAIHLDWEPLPLPVSENGSLELWDLDLEAADMRLRHDRIPETLLPLGPEE